MLCCTKRSKVAFVSNLGVKNGDKVYQMTPFGAPLFETCTCYHSPASSQSSFTDLRCVLALSERWLTLMDRSSPPRAIMTLMGGSVLLDSCVSIVALMEFCREGKKHQIFWSPGLFFFSSFGRYGNISYLEELKEHVIEVRGHVGDLDGPPVLVGCRAETTVSALCTHARTIIHTLNEECSQCMCASPFICLSSSSGAPR